MGDPNDRVQTRSVEYYQDSDGIVHGRFTVERSHLEDAIENIEAVRELAGGVKVPVFIDMRGVLVLEKEARDNHAGSVAAEVQSACALIIGSPVSRMIGNFFLGLNRPLCPTRLFTSPDDGMAWLRPAGA